MVSLALSIGVGVMHEGKTRPEPLTLNFKPAYNVTIGPQNVIAAYPEAGIDFTLNHAAGRLHIGTEAGQRTIDAEVFRLDSVTWTAAIMGGDWVTVNALTGQAELYMDGEYKCWTREASRP